MNNGNPNPYSRDYRSARDQAEPQHSHPALDELREIDERLYGLAAVLGPAE